MVPIVAPIFSLSKIVSIILCKGDEITTCCNSSDTFTVTGKNSYKIAFGDEFLLAATTLSYGICSTVQIPA